MVQTHQSLIERQQINEVLGSILSEQEFSKLRKQIKIIEPKVGLFWKTVSAEAGIYSNRQAS
ncbi:hypothetical protein [Crocosphaera sp.]|uniref:hypothetical protein n=1 Tax=Crocosphaera sp. TaxID=2729996 RepID=UPI00260F3A90|nr:hypothetical protein [Crocosphaera sp.]MDJ0582247.1 hypothetical protein [Crocosphaera sp.]